MRNTGIERNVTHPEALLCFMLLLLSYVSSTAMYDQIEISETKEIEKHLEKAVSDLDNLRGEGVTCASYRQYCAKKAGGSQSSELDEISPCMYILKRFFCENMTTTQDLRTIISDYEAVFDNAVRKNVQQKESARNR